MLLLCKILIVVTAVKLCVFLSPRRKNIRRLENCVTDYIKQYNSFKEIIDKDYDVEQIKKQYFELSNYTLCYLKINFGELENLQFSTSAQLRKCFLENGKIILDYEKQLQEMYNNCINERDGEFKEFMNIFDEILAISLEKGKR